jgi:hypothetical protein
MQVKKSVSMFTWRKIYKTKLAKALLVRDDEDITYQKQKKWSAYEGKRIIFFDNTNITIKQPTNAKAQQSAYSAYYGGNVRKGAVA